MKLQQLTDQLVALCKAGHGNYSICKVVDKGDCISELEERDVIVELNTRASDRLKWVTFTFLKPTRKPR